MPTLLIRIVLFFSSYSPLALIVAIHLWEHHRRSALGSLAIAVSSVLGLAFFLLKARGLAPSQMHVADVKSRDGDIMSYIVTYVLPFLAVKLEDTVDVLSFGVILVVVGVLYVNSNLIYVNPLLNLRGYHLFEVVDSNRKTVMLVTKSPYIRNESSIRVVSLGDYVVLEKP